MSDPGKDFTHERDRLRAEIDRLDDAILRLLNDRAGCAVGIGKIKKAVGEKVFDPEREQAIFSRLVGSNAGPLSADAVVRIFERIIDESRRVERLEATKK